ncbi:hypothetical protein IFM89_027270 [Coptis chinensis]|uniref:Alpha-N-acetylglucosaminidase tim-barrel domain-containing protein n=1 Tax=Coptis chinensis TaxID=261450 RepID=A0A835IQU3_9MAGN|nr:hypothetical protein IFM89_027270 [Coptis chinensis]
MVLQALLHSVPFGKMIVLDLFAYVKPIWEESSQFYGTPYVWCLLHNFGGNIEMYGILDVISSGPVDARISQNSTMVRDALFNFLHLSFSGVYDMLVCGRWNDSETSLA